MRKFPENELVNNDSGFKLKIEKTPYDNSNDITQKNELQNINLE